MPLMTISDDEFAALSKTTRVTKKDKSCPYPIAVQREKGI